MQPMMDGSVDVEEGLQLVEHGMHIAIMTVVFALSLLGAVFLVRFFLRPNAAQGLRRQTRRAPLRDEMNKFADNARTLGRSFMTSNRARRRSQNL